MTTQELKDYCNDAFDSAIKGMENGANPSDIHTLLTKVAQLLLAIGKISPADQTNCIAKCKKVLGYAKEIADKKSYDDVYFEIKGKALPVYKLDLEPLPDDLSGEEEPKDEKSAEQTPEEEVIKNEYIFNWDDLPRVSFDDVAGLADVKDAVNRKVLMPLKDPSLYEGYFSENGGGLLLYGPPGTGKTMIAAAIAHEIGAKFCTVGPSDILATGVGNSEKRIAELFKEAHSFPCAIIFFDELESLCPASTHSQVSRQVRSELLRQMQGMESYSHDTGKILFLIGASNKPWDIDSAFLRPGRLGTRVYVGLPDYDARKYIVESKLDKIRDAGIVKVADDINIDKIVDACNGFNGADINNVLNEVKENSGMRAVETNEKIILQEDFDLVLSKITSSVQEEDIKKLKEWTEANNA